MKRPLFVLSGLSKETQWRRSIDTGASSGIEVRHDAPREEEGDAGDNDCRNLGQKQKRPATEENSRKRATNRPITVRFVLLPRQGTVINSSVETFCLSYCDLYKLSQNRLYL